MAQEEEKWAAEVGLCWNSQEAFGKEREAGIRGSRGGTQSCPTTVSIWAFTSFLLMRDLSILFYMYLNFSIRYHVVGRRLRRRTAWCPRIWLMSSILQQTTCVQLKYVMVLLAVTRNILTLDVLHELEDFKQRDLSTLPATFINNVYLNKCNLAALSDLKQTECDL